MNIVNTISNGISKYIFTFCETIHEQYDIPVEDILKIWCEQQKISYTTEFAQYVGITKKQKKIKSAPKHDPLTESIVENEAETIVENEAESSSPSPKNSPSKNSEVNLCEYIFSKGIKKGQRCTTMTKNGTLCSKHKNKEN